jgi:hypothetical protein
MEAIGYIDPAVEGTTVILSCPPGKTLSGPHASMCMENGEWEPDPRKAECIGIIIISFITKGLAYQYCFIVLKTDNKSSSLSQDVKIIIASVTVFVGNSALLLVVVFLYNCFHPKFGSVHTTVPTPEKTDSEVPSATTIIRNVDLRENIAYLPVQL